MTQKTNGTTPQGMPEQPQFPQRYVSPEVNIFETTDGYLLEADLPGVSKEGVEVAIEANTLTVTGRRNHPELDAVELYRESETADYRRVFELDPAIDAARITAKLDQGVLTLTLPKSERAKPRKVAVTD